MWKKLQSIRDKDIKKTKQTKIDKQYAEYDWQSLVQNGELSRLYVSELSKCTNTFSTNTFIQTKYIIGKNAFKTSDKAVN